MDNELDPALVQSIKYTLANNYASVAFVMVLLYDMVITFGDEVEYVWLKGGMSMGKLLFFLNRYIPPIDLVILINTYVNPRIDQRICMPFFKIDNWLSVFSLAIVDIVLLLRTYALWNRSKKVLTALVLLFVFCTLATTGAVVYFTLAAFPIPFPKQIRPCEDAFKEINVVEAVWGSTILFDTGILIFTLVKIVPFFKTNTVTVLLKNIYQDGFVYFAVLFAISTANLFTFAMAPANFKLTLVTLQRVMFSLLCSRIVLNLRGVLTRRTLATGDPHSTSKFDAEMSTLRAVSGRSTLTGGTILAFKHVHSVTYADSPPPQSPRTPNSATSFIPKGHKPYGWDVAEATMIEEEKFDEEETRGGNEEVMQAV